jgi:hypothetical protein
MLKARGENMLRTHWEGTRGMYHRARRLVGIGAVTALVAALCLSVVTTPAAQEADYQPPRLEGTEVPDLNGIWQAVNTANWDLLAHAAGPSPAPRQLGAYGAMPAGLGVVEGNEIPYRPEVAAKRQENFARRLEVDPFERYDPGDPEAKCYLPGVPRVTYMPHPFQILQSTDKILISYEFASASRIIHMTNHGEPPADSWMGWSNGRWEGNTLVVEVTGQNEYTWFDRAGDFHSNGLRVVERYTPITPYHLQYEATIEDPDVFTRPWTISMPLYRRMDPQMQLLEFECVPFAEEFMYWTLARQPE